jgi:hypothetical protein
MIKYTQKIREILVEAYDYIIVPKTVMDSPIELSTMTKVDEDGNDIGYASINELCQAMGSLLAPIEVSELHVAYRWSYDIGLNEHTNFMTYLTSKGLVNMRDEDGNFDLTIPNGVAMCSRKVFKELPRYENMVEETL